jgi:hypothetical protein
MLNSVPGHRGISVLLPFLFIRAFRTIDQVLEFSMLRASMYLSFETACLARPQSLEYSRKTTSEYWESGTISPLMLLACASWRGEKM